MARRKLYIPNEIKEDIRKHLSSKYPLALEGFFSANEEEDALTGDLGATLRIKDQKVFVRNSQIEAPGTWTWSIDYRKFRGRGPGATENKLGADGIFELTLKIGSKVERKSLMFQSKINWTNDINLIKESIRLTTWREAAFILNFTSSEFEAIDLDSIISSKGKRNNVVKFTPLDKYIGTTFLDCIVGDLDLKYDAVSRKLIWKSSGGKLVATKFSIPHKISINVSAPTLLFGHNQEFEEIKNEEIHNYRMDSSEEEILSLGNNFTNSDLGRAHKSKALIYHTDRHVLQDEQLKELLNRRMQEINYAYDRLKEKLRK